MKLTPFHLAVQVHDINEARHFYGEILSCEEGRSAVHWVDFNLFGHQLVCHLNPDLRASSNAPRPHHNRVDSHDVPVPHFGVVLKMKQWKTLAERLKIQKIEFIIEPYVRFEGQVGEQATMFFQDPSGNVLEFKAFKDLRQLFAR